MSFAEIDSSMPEPGRFSIRMAKPLFVFLLILVPVSLCVLFLRSCANAHFRGIGHSDFTIDVSGSGDSLVFNAAGTGGSDLYVLRLGDLSVTRIAETSEYEVTPSFSPDAKSVVYAAGIAGDRADHIFVRSLDGADTRQLTHADANDESPRLSPDGTTVVFERSKTYNWVGLAGNWLGRVICVVGIDGNNERQITADAALAYRPRFSADGKSVNYSTDDGVVSVPLDGSSPPAKVSSVPGASISPGGEVIAYRRGEFSPDTKIYVANPDGTDERLVSGALSGCSRPVFSANGDSVYFFREEWPDGPMGLSKHSIWQVNTDGQNLRMVTTSRIFDEPLSWKPDASK
jgi:Tol biopolymer transport system component